MSFFACRLTLPGRIVEDGREKASYNTDEGIGWCIGICVIENVAISSNLYLKTEAIKQ